MKKTGIFLAEGFEEVEALTVVDILRRAGVICDMVAIGEKLEVTGSHGITVKADQMFDQKKAAEYDGLILPGGMPGTLNLGAHVKLTETLKEYASQGRLVAAICAAPTVLGAQKILIGKKATCYPGMEDQLTGAEHLTLPVVTDGNIITSRGLGTAIEFALAILNWLGLNIKADEIAHGIVYR